MPQRDDDLAARIADLDARLCEVEALQALTLRILSTTRPLDALLAQHGASESQQHSLYRLLDTLSARVKRVRARTANRVVLPDEIRRDLPAPGGSCPRGARGRDAENRAAVVPRSVRVHDRPGLGK